MRASSAMTRQVLWIVPTDDLCLAHELMKMLRIRHLPVLEAGRLVGILSDRDVLTYSGTRAGTLDVPSIPVCDVMTRDVISCSATASIATVCARMLAAKIDSIPIVENETLVGLVTSTDLIQLLMEREDIIQDRLPFAFELREGLPAAS